jgi:hypothetical protein
MMATERRSVRRVSNRRRLVRGLALALTAASLVIPGAASAAQLEGPQLGAPIANDQADQATAPARDQTAVTLRRDGSKAVPFVAESSDAATAGDSAGGFDWGDAMIGAGAALALVALIGAGGFTIRGRQRVAPATPSHG